MKIRPAASTISVLATLLFSGLLVSCGSGRSAQDAGGVKLTQVLVTPANQTIAKGSTQQFSATAVYSDSTKRSLGTSVTWQTSQSGIAEVDAQGNVKGMGVGVAQVSATYQQVTGSTSVTVGAAALLSIAVSPNQSLLPVGESEQLTAKGSFSDGSVQDLTQSATWSSSGSVANVGPSGNVVAKALGTATINATSGSVTGSASLTVASAALLSIAVSPNQSSLPVGESEQLIATGTFSDGTVQNLTQSVTWSSSGSAIANVGPSGNVVAKALGTATINATTGTVTGSAGLAVTAAAVTALSVNPPTMSLVLGGSGQFQAMATMSDGSTQDVSGTATWSSTPSGIVSVGGGGMATAQRPGSTTIQAQAGGFTGSATLAVMPLMLVNYYARSSAVASGIDGTVYLTNPGLTSTSLCAMIYVFDQNQELNECCGCLISDSGLRTLSLLVDLTANPLTGIAPNAGEIKVVPSDPGSTCDPGSPTPDGALNGWETNVQVDSSTGSAQVTETAFDEIQLGSSEGTLMANLCSFLEQLGSGQGICSCGTGDGGAAKARVRKH